MDRKFSATKNVTEKLSEFASYSCFYKGKCKTGHFLIGKSSGFVSLAALLGTRFDGADGQARGGDVFALSVGRLISVVIGVVGW
jgi:hypothetical protein